MLEQAAWAALALWGLCSLVNLAFTFHTAEQWVSLASKHPRWSRLVHLSRAIGLDPATALRGLHRVGQVGAAATAGKARAALKSLGGLSVGAALLGADDDNDPSQQGPK